MVCSWTDVRRWLCPRAARWLLRLKSEPTRVERVAAASFFRCCPHHRKLKVAGTDSINPLLTTHIQDFSDILMCLYVFFSACFLYTEKPRSVPADSGPSQRSHLLVTSYQAAPFVWILFTENISTFTVGHLMEYKVSS